MIEKSLYKDTSAMNHLNVLHLQRYLDGHNGYVAGGCFKNIFQKEEVRDIDLFFESESEFKVAKDLYDENESYSHIYENDNAIGYYDKANETAIDLVRSQFLSPQEMIEGFDFTVTKFALYKEEIEVDSDETTQSDEVSVQPMLTGDFFKNDDEKAEDSEVEYEVRVVYHEDFFEHLMLKRLVIDEDEIQFPLNTFDRVLKYIKYGYTPCLGTKTKLVRIINSSVLPEDDSELFRGFYAGVD